MKFSADMFKQIIATLRSDGSGARGHEKRVEGRVGLRCSVDIIPFQFGDKGSKGVTVWVRDLSVSGIGLVSARPFEANVEFVVGFVRDNRKPLSVRYKVRYCKRLARDLHSIGASFERFEDSGDAKTVMGALISKVHPPKELEEKADAAEPELQETAKA